MSDTRAVHTPPPASITLNGAPRSLAVGETVTDLVAGATGRQIAADGQAVDGGRLGVAVARNSEVVPRSRWATTVLEAGDDVEVVTAVQGG
ncbi:sulfur carrier protein ThiS [Cryobacterium psychrophilum]|uniref:Sulfur carrier protein ThiS n=1 Tax=Cryobacterium psychrophilum TaxID=41988 RepID=A0A4Y8KJF8_9MICO|nr:sulfur carrier protein ThiS [Cryobacterium psychrophilum]TDW26960.1 sulfur carrier protein [Cryobacterium psychrophilum]TFD75362.1 sulfur carrier protein ThiS [Cryobacterium psychrophilum]